MYLLWPAETTRPLPVPPAISFQAPSCTLAGPGASSLLGPLGRGTAGLQMLETQEGNPRRKEAKERRSQVLNVRGLLPKAAALVPF